MASSCTPPKQARLSPSPSRRAAGQLTPLIHWHSVHHLRQTMNADEVTETVRLSSAERHEIRRRRKSANPKVMRTASAITLRSWEEADGPTLAQLRAPVPASSAVREPPAPTAPPALVKMGNLSFDFGAIDSTFASRVGKREAFAEFSRELAALREAPRGTYSREQILKMLSASDSLTSSMGRTMLNKGLRNSLVRLHQQLQPKASENSEEQAGRAALLLSEIQSTSGRTLDIISPRLRANSEAPSSDDLLKPNRSRSQSSAETGLGASHGDGGSCSTSSKSTSSVGPSSSGSLAFSAGGAIPDITLYRTPAGHMNIRSGTVPSILRQLLRWGGEAGASLQKAASQEMTEALIHSYRNVISTAGLLQIVIGFYHEEVALPKSLAGSSEKTKENVFDRAKQPIIEFMECWLIIAFCPDFSEHISEEHLLSTTSTSSKQTGRRFKKTPAYDDLMQFISTMNPRHQPRLWPWLDEAHREKESRRRFTDAQRTQRAS
ncbi:MAG: hypothetical protein Q8P67_29190, partial [archaeon]|nr:hypothetical protein [archaeon]